MRRLSAALALTLLTSLGLAACGGGGDDPARDLADRLAAGLEAVPDTAGHLATFDGVTFDGLTADQASSEYAATVVGMDRIKPTVTVGGVSDGSRTRTATLHWSWPLVEDHDPWTYDTKVSLVEHGFFKAEEANDFLKPENLMAPAGKLPLNTSGGNLAECYMHGLELPLPPPTSSSQATGAVEFLVETLRATTDRITLVPRS